MKLIVSVRVCRQRRAKEGFYAIFNGQRLWFKSRAAALDAVQSLLDLQCLQVTTVKQYAKKTAKTQK